MTANKTTLKCLDWSNPELALRSKQQNLDILFAPCHQLPKIYGIKEYTEDWIENPEFDAFLEKECGSAPEDYNLWAYHANRYDDYLGS